MSGARREMTGEEALALALRWAEAGVPAFPVAISWDQGKRSTNKRPLCASGFRDATTDAAALAALFAAATPRPGVCLGVGLWPGPAGYVVLDVDTKGAARGDEELLLLEEEHGRLPDTPRVTTASGGSHIWLRKGDRHVGNGDLVTGHIEVRADDGFVVAPGVVTPWGSWAFDFDTGDVLDGAPVAEVPAWVLARLNGAGPASSGHAGHWGRVNPDDLHPADRAALEALKRLGGHGEYLSRRTLEDGTAEETLRITRPGNRSGTGATIGYSAPGSVKVFTNAWAVFADDKTPFLQENATYGADHLADIAAAVEADDRQKAAELVDPLHWMKSGAAEAPAGDGSPTAPVQLHEAALYGLPGDFVRAVAPTTESDPVALLAQFLTAYGCAVGAGPHFVVEETRHHANIFGVIVADTGGRKGTSLDRVRRVFEQADQGWTIHCIESGLSSGEGLIWRVRDEVKNGDGDVTQAGVDDKRLWVIETEFANVLKVATREGNTLSPVLRQAWDGDHLRTLTKHSPAKATGAHVAITGHITPAEAERYVTETEAANGWGNRLLWLAARRVRFLPEGGRVDGAVMAELVARTRRNLQAARTIGQVKFHPDARTLWHAMYAELSERRPGLLGAITGRAEAQTIRLALLYALTDASKVILLEHLEAALALWVHAEQSAAAVFGDALGDPDVDRVDSELRSRGRLSRTEISEVFGRNRSATQIDRALRILLAAGRVEKQIEAKAPGTAGRPTEWWVHQLAPRSERGLLRFIRTSYVRNKPQEEPPTNERTTKTTKETPFNEDEVPFSDEGWVA